MTKTDKYELYDFFIRLSRYQLTAKQMKYLIWKLMCGKTHREIAELEEISYQAVSWSIRRAYKKIKEFLPATLPKQES